jgi:1-aminocyclopropane-1-carboxylate deaminase
MIDNSGHSPKTDWTDYLCNMFDQLYSPLQRLNHPLLSQFYVKRDDLIDPYISGNKWRKLKYILEKAKQEGKTHFVTFGGAYSNHLLATASAAARAGLKATAFVRGEVVNNEMLLLCKLFGMTLLFTERTAYKDKHNLFNEHFADDPLAYFIDEGGASEEAVKGCAEIIAELPEDIDYLFCAAGTGTTAAGLLKGTLASNRSAELHVVPVLKNGAFIKDEMARYLSVDKQLTLHTDYHFGGYAKTQPALLNFLHKFTADHGFLVDPVYTAKMFYAIEDLAKQGLLPKDAKIVALHTGGLLGILGMKDKLGQM